MTDESKIREFILSPDTIDLMVRKTAAVENYAKNNPNFILTQTISDRYMVAYTNRNNLDTLFKDLGNNFYSSLPLILGIMDRSNLDAAGIIQVQDQPYLNLTGNGVIIGMVDTGIDYTLDVFKYEDGTSKIRYIFDQTATDGNNPEGFIIGTEYDNNKINEALKSKDPLSIVPEQDTDGHGTFLASIAAGRPVGDYIGAAPDSDLIVVKLKKARPYYYERYMIPKEQNNVFESSALMVGIEYILRKARKLNRPVAICIGLGTNSGSHDGFNILEEYLRSISNLEGNCICVAAGNESQARHHTQGKLTEKGQQQNIDIKVGEDAGDIYVTIWNTVSDKISISVRSPTGELVGRVPPKSGVVLQRKLILENALVRVSYFFPVDISGGQLSSVRIFNATPGIWTITVYGDIVLDGTYHAWLPITGFISPNVEFLAAIPYTTITVPATARGIITCGGYNSGNSSLYSQSSWGPTRLPSMSPDFVAPAVNVGGYFPGNVYGTMSGTSVSTAITTGASALMLQWGIVNKNNVDMSTFQIRAYLIRGCIRNETLTYPNPKWGYGILNLMNTFDQMREM